jgi:hypothetical protein
MEGIRRARYRNSQNSMEILKIFAAAMSQPDKNYRNKQD